MSTEQRKEKVAGRQAASEIVDFLMKEASRDYAIAFLGIIEGSKDEILTALALRTVG